MRPGCIRGARRSTRGDVSIQLLILVGCVALAGGAAFVVFGNAVHQKVQEERQHVVDLTAMGGGGTGAAGGSCPNGMCVPGSGNCFVAGTPVLTRHGTVPIEQIRAGDEVLSRDPDDGHLVAATVGTTYVRLAPSLTRVTIRRAGSAPALSPSAIADLSESDETLYATPEHLFWTVARGWQGAGDLTASDSVVDERGEELRVLGSESIAASAVVFNFEVEKTHTYFVGSTPILVHNPNYPPTPSAGGTSDPGTGNPSQANDHGAGGGSAGGGASPFGIGPWGEGPSSQGSSTNVPSTVATQQQWIASLQKFSGNTENGQKVTFVKSSYPTASADADAIKHSKPGVSPQNVIVIGKNDAMPINGTQRVAEIEAARRIVQDYLDRIGETGTIGEVHFVRQETLGEGVEGITHPNTHVVDINGKFHTTGTIVHEMFHSLSHPKHDSLFNVSKPVNEGLTEYLTNQATGHDRRYARDGNGVYSAELEAVRRAIQSGAITDEDVRNAYFRGDQQAIAKVTDAVFHELPTAEQVRQDRWDGENARFKPWLIHGPPPAAR